ncbi:DNA-directed RNA polymerase subunit beta [Aerococcaceae bacterium NML160702]|nr:DNA-directed RNA polymerase subunit beta [Aerococcaceae bacterium NML180378]MCW6681466.1 DNA-directed RNA polymerase subunit beta [Aerococcaceae bacterium NML160702]MDO4775195.1 DNA-directed RNA polymerase subunit beta [Aerococcaceae bacterium]
MEREYLQESLVAKVLKSTLKIIIFLILLVLFFVVGLFIGYSVLGNGNFWEVLNRDTWQHIIDFVNP